MSGGPAAGFGEFFAARYASAVRGAYLLTGSREAAEDVVQDAFRQVFERWQDIRHHDSYLWRAVTNGARSWGRVEHRARRAPLAEEAVGVDSDVLAVRAVLAALGAAQREALMLRYFLGLNDREIAESVGRPLGTVKSNLRRGLRAMRKALA